MGLFEEAEKIPSIDELASFTDTELLNQEIDGLCWELYNYDSATVYGESIYTYSKERLEEILNDLKEKINLDKKIEHTTKGQYKLKELWRRAWNSVIYEQPEMCDFYFYVLMGQLFFPYYKIFRKGDEDDLRIHSVVIGGSGTGKTQANNFLAGIIQQVKKTEYTDPETGDLKIKYYEVASPIKYTDASLIGNLDSELFKEQKRRRINEEDDRYIAPIQKGLLQSGDLVVFDEAESVLEPGRFGQESQRILRNAMNKYGSKYNLLSNDSLGSKGLVKFHCAASIILTSYPLKKFDETFKTGGLLQRCVILILPPDPEKKQEITTRMFNDVPTTDEEAEQYEIEHSKDVQNLVNALNLILDKIKDDTKIKYWIEDLYIKANDMRKKLIHSKKARKLYDKYSNEIENILPMPNLEDQENFNSIMSRINLIQMKASGINFLCAKYFDNRKESKILSVDVDEAFKTLIKPAALSSAEHIKMGSKETRLDQQKLIQTLRKILIKPMKKGELVDQMMDEIGYGKNRVISILKQMKAAGYYEEKKDAIDNKTIICEITKKYKMF